MEDKQIVIEGWWEENFQLVEDVSENVFCLGLVSLEHEDENLAPLDGCWSRESLPKLAALAASLGVRIHNPEQGWFLDEKF